MGIRSSRLDHLDDLRRKIKAELDREREVGLKEALADPLNNIEDIFKFVYDGKIEIRLKVNKYKFVQIEELEKAAK